MTDTAPQTPTTIQELLADTFRFTRRELAFSFAERSTKGLWVMLGVTGGTGLPRPPAAPSWSGWAMSTQCDASLLRDVSAGKKLPRKVLLTPTGA